MNVFESIKSNNQGSTMIVALLILIALSLSVFMAMDGSITNSKMMRNSRDYRDNFYRAETGISVATELAQATWLSPTSLLFDMSDGNAEINNANVEIIDEDGDPIDIAAYEIARIEDYNGKSEIDDKLDADALTRSFYSLAHTSPPPVGSKMSPKNFEIRRYGIHSQANPRKGSGRITLENGLFKLFNKYS